MILKQEKSGGGLFSTWLPQMMQLAGGAIGGPVGAAVGNTVGNLAGGKSIGNSLMSGAMTGLTNGAFKGGSSPMPNDNFAYAQDRLQQNWLDKFKEGNKWGGWQ